MKPSGEKGNKQSKSDRKGGPELWELVQSLTPSEKATFTKLHANQGKEELFKLLFDDLNTANQYDEDQFRTLFSERPYQSNFTYQKNYLYERLLKDMVVQQLKTMESGPGGKELGVRSLLEQGKFLKDKRLFAQAGKRLKKAKKEAYEYEFHEIALEILRTDRSLLLASQVKGYEKVLAQLHDEIDKVIKIIANKFEILAKRDAALHDIRKDASSRAPKILAKTTLHPILSDPEKALSGDARTSQLHAQVSIFLKSGKEKEALNSGRILLDEWEKWPSLKSARPLDFRNSIYNYLNMLIELEPEVEGRFLQLADQLIKKPFSSSIEQGEMENHHIYLRLQFAVNKQNWYEAIKIEQEYLKREPKLKKVIQHTRYISYAALFGMANLMQKQYAPATEWLNRAIHNGNLEIAKHLRRLSRIMLMALSWETNHLDELESVYRSITRQINWRHEYSEWEQLAVESLQNLQNRTDIPPIQALRELVAHIENLTKEDYSPGANWLGLWVGRLGV